MIECVFKNSVLEREMERYIIEGREETIERCYIWTKRAVDSQPNSLFWKDALIFFEPLYEKYISRKNA